MEQISPLVAAIARNDAKLFEQKLQDGEHINGVDSDGRTPLIHATIDAKDDFVRRLVEAGADPNKQDKLGNSALHYAAQNFAVTAAKTLIAAGAKIDIVDLHGNTPLWRAVFNSRGRGDVIKQLLAAGADRNHINKSGKTPINLAQTISNYDMKQFF